MQTLRLEFRCKIRIQTRGIVPEANPCDKSLQLVPQRVPSLKVGRMTFTPTSSVAASSTGFSYLIFFSAKNDWETGRQLVNHYTVYFRAGDLGRGSVCGTLEGTTPCNKSRGQVPLCELTIFASTFSRGEPTLVPATGLTHSNWFEFLLQVPAISSLKRLM